MRTPSVPHDVGDFRVMPVKFSLKSDAGHMLYYKDHSVKDADDSKPTDRTLFVVNVPPYCNQECLERLFGKNGAIESVILQTKPGKEENNSLEKVYPTRKKGFKVAYVVFKDATSISRMMKQKFQELLILSPDGNSSITTGYRKWCADYTAMWPDPKLLQKTADDHMAEYDQNKKEEAKESKETEGVPDEDGWVTVTRKSSKPVVARTERQQKRLRAKEKKKREEKELMNFYTFQTRESKREYLADLRKKFEEDKQRVAEMRAARKFKPY